MRRPIVAAGNDRGGSPHGKTRCVIAAADPCFEAVLFVKVIRAFLGYPRVSGMGDFIPRAVGMTNPFRTRGQGSFPDDCRSAPAVMA